MWLLAATDPTPGDEIGKEQLKEFGQEIAESVGRGLEEGLKATAQSAPTNWIQMVGSVAALIVLALLVVWIVWKFLEQLRKLSEDNASLFREVMSTTGKQADSCHAVQVKTQAMAGEQVADLKEVAKDMREMHHDTRSLIEKAFDKLNGKH